MLEIVCKIAFVVSVALGVHSYVTGDLEGGSGFLNSSILFYLIWRVHALESRIPKK